MIPVIASALRQTSLITTNQIPTSLCLGPRGPCPTALLVYCIQQRVNALLQAAASAKSRLVGVIAMYNMYH